jgi:hypothetical protein
MIPHINCIFARLACTIKQFSRSRLDYPAAGAFEAYLSVKGEFYNYVLLAASLYKF